jgi:hypothetical protein
MEVPMAWVKVESYSFGYSPTERKFWLYYTLQGATSTTQVFLTPTQFHAAAQLFGSASAVDFETTGKYFATAPRTF